VHRWLINFLDITDIPERDRNKPACSNTTPCTHLERQILCEIMENSRGHFIFFGVSLRLRKQKITTFSSISRKYK